MVQKEIFYFVLSQNKSDLSLVKYIVKNQHKLSYSILNYLCECYIINYDEVKKIIPFSELCQRYNLSENINMKL